MKVVTVANVPPNKMGSFEKFLRDHSWYLSQSGFEHTIILPQEPIQEVAEALHLAGAKIIVFENLHVNELSVAIRLYRKVLAEKPLVVHVHFVYILGWFSLFMIFNKIKFFATYHISGPIAEQTTYKKVYKKLRWLMLGVSYNRIFCVSEYTRVKFINNYAAAPDSVSVVYNAVNQEEYKKYREKFQIKNAEVHRSINLISVAALIPEKGIQYLVKACAELSEIGMEYNLLIIGEGPYRSQLEDLVHELNVQEKVEFLGTRNDVPNLLSAGDIMIVPSVWEEAFGFTILEAMSIGVPLIVSNVGGIPELVSHNFNGLVVEKASSEQIKNAIIQLSQSYSVRESFSKRSIVRSIDKFSVDLQCSKLVSEYLS